MGRFTVLVTGATDGIGKATAIQLAKLGHNVVVHGRNPTKVNAVVEEVTRQAKDKSVVVDSVVADLSDLRQVSALAREVERRFPKLNVLLNNAAIFPTSRVLLNGSFESTFLVNHLALFLLTNELLPLLKRNGPSRIVNTSSLLHTYGKLDFDNLQAEKEFDSQAAYSLSKLATVMYTNDLANRVKSSEVTVNSLHPGVVYTNMLNSVWPDYAGGLSVDDGCKTSVFLAVGPEVEGVTGNYYDKCEVTKVHPDAENNELRTKLWDVTQSLIDKYFETTK